MKKEASLNRQIGKVPTNFWFIHKLHVVCLKCSQLHIYYNFAVYLISSCNFLIFLQRLKLLFHFQNIVLSLSWQKQRKMIPHSASFRMLLGERWFPYYSHEHSNTNPLKRMSRALRWQYSHWDVYNEKKLLRCRNSIEKVPFLFV